MNERKGKSTTGAEDDFMEKPGPLRIGSTLPKHAYKSVSTFLELLTHFCSQLSNGQKNEHNLLKSKQWERSQTKML